MIQARQSRLLSRGAVALVLLAVSVVGVRASAETPPRAVVELFTSQGCSSCPPADRLMQDLVERDELVALSFPVDYWDYLGWRDTLASPAHSARQRAYAELRGDREVYTPQIVVNGQRHLVGSDAGALDQALSEQQRLPVRVDLVPGNDVMEILVSGDASVLAGPGDKPAMASVVFAFVSDPVAVAIGRGENRGREVVYSNVVKGLRVVGMWDGGTATYRLPMSEMTKMNAARCAVLVQLEHNGSPGRILGAAIR